MFCEALLSKYKLKMELVAGSAFFALFIPYLLSSVIRVSAQPHRLAYILAPIAIPFLSDIFALFSGMLFGKHKLATSISPNKTVEGSIGGILGAAAGTLLYGLIISSIFSLQANYLFLAIYGFLGSIVAQIGDLSFSYIKRVHKIKDYGNLMPGHGGVLDRFDSVIFCAPLIEILIYIIPAFS